jgi:hypothetical protein
MCASPAAGQPVTAVFCRTKHIVISLQVCECAFDMLLPDKGNVTANDYAVLPVKLLKHKAHTSPEIAARLNYYRQSGK